MAFHVFVEGATDGSPAGVTRLAQAIAQHYGLPAADLLTRLKQGRFRVKGNIDRTTAEQYRRDLERLGARCTIEEASANAQTSQRVTPIPFPAVRPATPPAGTPQYQSGLAAAFSGDMPAASLGALEQDGAAFSLASVDGADDKAPASDAAFAPPAGAHSASIGPPPEKPKPAGAKPGAKPAAEKSAKADRPKDVPLDLFAPPDAQGDELKVDIATDELEHSARKRASTPLPVPSEPPVSQKIPRAQSEPSARKSQPSLQAASPAPEVVARSSKLGPLADPRARFAAGVVLAILIGFVPAHLVASMREGSTYKDIDTKVMAAQQLADTPEAYAMLDRMRADQLEVKQGEQRNIAIIALAIWAVVGAGVGFAWFKKVPWDRFE